MIDFWIGQSRKCLILRVPSLLTNMLNIQSILKNKIGEVLIHLEIQLNHIEEIPSFHTLEKNHWTHNNRTLQPIFQRDAFPPEVPISP